MIHVHFQTRVMITADLVSQDTGPFYPFFCSLKIKIIMTKRKRTITTLQIEKGGKSIVNYLLFWKINNKSFFFYKYFCWCFLTKTETSFNFKLPWTFEIKTIIDLLSYVGRMLIEPPKFHFNLWWSYLICSPYMASKVPPQHL